MPNRLGPEDRREVQSSPRPKGRQSLPLGIICTLPRVRFFYCFENERAGLGCPLTLGAEHVARGTSGIHSGTLSRLLTVQTGLSGRPEPSLEVRGQAAWPSQT